jgi:hypothetical protein
MSHELRVDLDMGNATVAHGSGDAGPTEADNENLVALRHLRLGEVDHMQISPADLSWWLGANHVDNS